MVTFSLTFALGAWLLQQQAALPDLALAWLIALLLPLLFLSYPAFKLRLVRLLLLAALGTASGFFYAAALAGQRLQDILPAEWQQRDIVMTGVVAELPRIRERGQGFTFDVEAVETPGAHVPRHILLSTYPDKNSPLEMHAGERWRLTVRLKRPHGEANPHGFDFEAWMLEQNLGATGYVRNDGGNTRLDSRINNPSYLIEVMRESVRNYIRSALPDPDYPYSGVLAALTIGDQGSIPNAQWKVFTRTGVNHLMSISGLHITMLSGLAFALAYAAWRRSRHLPLRLPARKAAAIAGLLAAFAYALLSGFSVPAQRTVYMLGAIAAALFFTRNIAASQILAASLLTVLFLDPWSVLAPGFWLSFGAVALILYVSANRIGRIRWAVQYGRVQWAVTVGLIPPLLAIFQQLSLVSPLANAFAIPLVEFIVVPLALFGALLHFKWALIASHYAMGLCMAALEWLNGLPEAVWTQHAPPAWSIAIGMLGVLWLLLPRGFPARWLGIILMLPMFLTPPEPPPAGALHLVIFDVGQGLSVAAQTHTHALLYDSGPRYTSEADSGNRILVSSLRAQGIPRLDELILTHDDTDHTGGALSVMQEIPIDKLLTSLPGDSPIVKEAKSHAQCADGQKWEWDGVSFEILHPDPASYADENVSKNNRGCTLRISTGKNNILLTADIEKSSEARLLKRHPDKLPAALLVVPHHGSKTSSTPGFVAAVHPRYAVITSGYLNRFGHPKAEIVERYRAVDSEILRSDTDGAILVDMDAENLSVEPYRTTHARYWQSSP